MPIHPSERVPDLETRKADRQAHQVLRSCPGEHRHVTARFQHAQALGPHGGRRNKTVPVLTHEPALLRGYGLSVTGHPCGENVSNLRGLRVRQAVGRVADYRINTVVGQVSKNLQAIPVTNINTGQVLS